MKEKVEFDFVTPCTNQIRPVGFRHVGDLRIIGYAEGNGPFEWPDITLEMVYLNGVDITAFFGFLVDQWGLESFERHIVDIAQQHISKNIAV